jgi:hypothetical protein
MAALALYNQHHFFEPNEIRRYSIGTKSRAHKHHIDGSLTIYVQADPPAAELVANCSTGLYTLLPKSLQQRRPGVVGWKRRPNAPGPSLPPQSHPLAARSTSPSRTRPRGRGGDRVRWSTIVLVK